MFDNQAFVNYQAPPQLLADKIIVITGAGSGIGKTAALSFAEHGATVVLLGRTLAKLEQTYDEIENAGYPKPAIFPINLEGAAPEDYNELSTALESEFGRVDGILHNASLLGARTPIDNYPLRDWQSLMQVNVTAPFLLTKALLKLLRKSDAGRVLFTSSGVADKGRAYWGGYAVSKAATNNLMEVLADELEKTNIRVNSINPGATRTPMRAEAYPGEDPATVTPACEIMNRYLYLMGQDSDSVHGQRLHAQIK